MTQYLIDTTIEQSVDFLAHRKVGLAHGVVPSLGKLASYKKADEPAPGAAPAPSTEPGAAPDAGGGTLASLLANPSVQAALAGTGIGGIAGLLAGLRRKKERRNLLRDALTGAVAGGVGLGGLSLAANAFSGDGAPTVESVGLPGSSSKDIAAWRSKRLDAGRSDEQINAEFSRMFSQLSRPAQMAWQKGTESSGTWIDPSALLETAGNIIDTGTQSAMGIGRFTTDQVRGAASHMAGNRGEQESGGVVSDIGAYSAPVIGAGLLADQASKFKSRADFSGTRIGSVSDQLPTALHKRIEAIAAVPAAPKTPTASETKGTKAQSAVELTPVQVQQNDLRNMYTRHLDAANLSTPHRATIDAAFQPTASAAQRTALSELLTGKDKNAIKAVEGFLNEVSRSEAKYKPTADGQRWASIAAPVHSPGFLGGQGLSKFQSMIQRGKIPLLNKHTGMNPHTRKSNIPQSPRLGRVPWKNNWVRGGGATAAALAGVLGYAYDTVHRDTDTAGGTRDLATDIINKAGNK